MTALPKVQSLSDFQLNTEEHLRHLKETGMPEVLTVDGKAELVVQSAETYQALVDRLELFESAQRIQRAMEDHRAGKSLSLEEFDREMDALAEELGLGS